MPQSDIDTTGASESLASDGVLAAGECLAAGDVPATENPPADATLPASLTLPKGIELAASKWLPVPDEMAAGEKPPTSEAPYARENEEMPAAKTPSGQGVRVDESKPAD